MFLSDKHYSKKSAPIGKNGRRPSPSIPIQLYYSRPCAANMALMKDNITRINSRKKFRHITAKWITEF